MRLDANAPERLIETVPNAASPGFRSETVEPTASTVPAKSVPIARGNFDRVEHLHGAIANLPVQRVDGGRRHAHSVFTASCSRNKDSAARVARKPSARQTNQAAMPINAYRMVQTGPKTEDGGAQLG